MEAAETQISVFDGVLQMPETGIHTTDARQADETIGVILDSFDSDYSANYLRSMERECSRRGINMLLKCTYGSIETENQAIKSCIEPSHVL